MQATESAVLIASSASPDVQGLWDETLRVIRGELNTVTFDTWFSTATPLALDGDTFVIGATNTFGRKWLEDRFSGLLAATLTQVAGRPLTVRIVVAAEGAPLAEAGADHEDVESTVEADVMPSMERVETERVREAVKGDFNEHYTFDSFVAGDSNQFAYQAALAVAETPGVAYNPLFIYGGAGLGKTHLLQAIGHYARTHFPHLKVKYVTTEQLTNDFLDSVKDRSGIEGFRRRYRVNSDVLLIDDIQFLISKEKTQDEFFHTFNELHNAHKQIVLTSDRPPKDLAPLSDRLVSRFDAGLIVDIQPPDLETRIAILRRKVADGGVPIPEEVLTFLAERVSSNIRELEGALIRICAYSRLTNQPIDLQVAGDWLKDAFPERTVRPIPISLIQQEVSKYYQISQAELVGGKRSQSIVYPRQVAMYLSRELTDLSLPRIGEEFGGRDHTTVIHAKNKIAKLLSEQRDVYNQVQALTNLIRHKM